MLIPLVGGMQVDKTSLAFQGVQISSTLPVLKLAVLFCRTKWDTRALYQKVCAGRFSRWLAGMKNFIANDYF